MIYKSLNLALIIRLFIFALLVGFTTILVVQHKWFAGSLIFMFVVFSGWNIIYYANVVNRKISFFFDAVRNDDNTLHFPENVRTRSVQTLHKSLNSLNRRISEIKIRNEHNERFFKELLKYSSTGLLAVDDRGNIEIINDAALKFIGFNNITHFQLLNQKKPELHAILENLTPGQSQVVKILQGEDLRLLSIKVVWLNFSDRKYRLYSLYDIKAELEENELDTWQKLIRVITHEIMNSIAPITSLSNTLTRFLIRNGKPVTTADIAQKEIDQLLYGLDVIEKTGKGLMHFVDDYRRLTKIPKPVFKKIDVEKWLDGILMLLKNRIEDENIELERITKLYQGDLIGDETLLSQVIINLLNNSMDALQNLSDKRIVIRVNESLSGKFKISVSDNGTGIPAEEIEKIFIPFYTTKEKGSGIGLSLSRQIMRLHKGSITAVSVPGQQTTFTLHF